MITHLLLCNYGMYSTAGYEERSEMKSSNSLVLSSREFPIVSSSCDFEEKPVNNALQDFISDSQSKPAVVYFPRFRNHYKCGIILKTNKHAF